MSEILTFIMGGVIVLPILILFLKMLFNNNDDDFDSTHQSID
jgi:hypothetical protein